jgi:hypothetical protein
VLGGEREEGGRRRGDERCILHRARSWALSGTGIPASKPSREGKVGGGRSEEGDVSACRSRMEDRQQDGLLEQAALAWANGRLSSLQEQMDVDVEGGLGGECRGSGDVLRSQLALCEEGERLRLLHAAPACRED